MRVMHCISSMQGGGAERQLTYLAGELVRMGWEVHVALQSGGPNLARLDATGATVHRVTGRGHYDPRLIGQLFRVVRRVQPHLIQVWLPQMEALGALAALSSRTPWVFSERSSAEAYPPTLKNRLRRWIARRASAIVSNSSGGDRYWARQAGGAVRRFTIGNALPLQEIAAAPAADPGAMGIRDGEGIVLFAGRLEKEKNLANLAAALGAALSTRVARAVCCGEGPLEGDLRRWLEQHQLAARSRLAGYVPDLWSWMKRANVLVLPSRFEGHPNVVLEAMACGCPLVVSDIPAHRELLDEESALLVDASSSEGLARAIGRALDDPEAAARRASAARERVASCALSLRARQYDAMYREVLFPSSDRSI